MGMETNLVINFLQELCTNNNKEWFDSNRDYYLAAKAEVESIASGLIEHLNRFDSSIQGLEPKSCVFRIFRDARFAKDKPPYKTNFGMFFVPGGKKCIKAGYYLHIEPDASFIGGGIYMPPSVELKKIRSHIFSNAEEFISILNEPAFSSTFGQLDGDRLKTAPKGFPKDFEHIDLLRLKSYVVAHSVSDSDVRSGAVIDHAKRDFKVLYDFNNYINRAF